MSCWCLLIIFIISLPPRDPRGEGSTTPCPRRRTSFPPPAAGKFVNLTIDFDGTLAWNGRSAVDRPTMQGYISIEGREGSAT